VYWSVRLTVDGKRRRFFIHRLIAEAFISNPANKPEVNHKDGDKMNSVLVNLEWATEKENFEHARKIGLRKTVGEYRRKLTAAQVREVRSLSTSNTQLKIAKLFGIAQSRVSAIVRRETYQEVV